MGNKWALTKTITRSSTSSLDVPFSLAESVEAESVGDFCCCERIGQVLFVGEHEQVRIAQLVLVEHALQLLASFSNTVSVVGINHEDDTLRVLEVCDVLQKSETRFTVPSACSPHSVSIADGSCPLR